MLNMGKWWSREPLTDCEYVDFEKVGTLESFNSDGLRSIIYTMPHIPNMKEKTLRYPGHVEYIKVLKESGFFGTEKIEVNGNMISPLDVTSKILFNEWKLGETEEEITVLRVTLKGENAKWQIEEVVYSMHDEYSPETGHRLWRAQPVIQPRPQQICFWMACLMRKGFSPQNWLVNIKSVSTIFSPIWKRGTYII